MQTVPYWRNSWHWLFPAVGGCLVCWACFTLWQIYSASTDIRVTCSAGSPTTRRVQLANFLAHSAAANGLDVQLVDSAGSEEALQLLNSGEIDVGLVSGGFVQQNYPNVRQLATIGAEPMHLLIKSELVRDAQYDLAILKNRRLSLGLPGSGTYALAREILEFAGLKAKNQQGIGDFVESSISGDELVERAHAIREASPERAAQLVAELPDAVFHLNPLPSRVVKELVATADFELIPLPFCESFRINGSQHLGTQPHRIDRRHVTKSIIPASTYRVIPAIPANDCETLGVPLIVVSRFDLKPAAADRLIATLYDGPFASENPPADLLASSAEYPLHTALVSYLQRRKPVAMRDLADGLQKLLSFFGAFSAGVLAVVSFYRRRRAKSASVYVSEIGEIERLSWGQTPAIGTPTSRDDQEHIRNLEEKLVRLKQRIIDDYSVGRLTGEAAFANLMTLISDTRMSLKREQSARMTLPYKVVPRVRAEQLDKDARQKAAKFGT